jgi:hypothetical protein
MLSRKSKKRKKYMSQVRGDSSTDDAVVGLANNVPGKSGVFGFNAAAGGNGVAGISDNGNGVFAKSTNQFGLFGTSDNGDAILGVANSAAKSGVFGNNVSTGDANAPGGSGVFGLTVAGGAAGVFGANNHSTKGRGVQGNGPEAGVGGFSDTDHGVGVLAESKNIGIKAQGGRLAGRFEGDVEVTGDIRLVNAADCAEDFDVSGTQEIEPGTVMVIDQEGALEPSQRAYDKRVAGVISGAGGLKPGIVLDNQQSRGNRMPVALLGKVYCKVDAQYSPIEVGDLLASSPTPGHAMKAADPLKAFGSVIGKALRPLQAGQGLVPVLVALQ